MGAKKQGREGFERNIRKSKMTNDMNFTFFLFLPHYCRLLLLGSLKFRTRLLPQARQIVSPL